MEERTGKNNRKEGRVKWRDSKQRQLQKKELREGLFVMQKAVSQKKSELRAPLSKFPLLND